MFSVPRAVFPPHRRREQRTTSTRAPGSSTGRRGACVSLAIRCDSLPPQPSAQEAVVCISIPVYIAELSAPSQICLLMRLVYRKTAYPLYRPSHHGDPVTYMSSIWNSFLSMLGCFCRLRRWKSQNSGDRLCWISLRTCEHSRGKTRRGPCGWGQGWGWGCLDGTHDLRAPRPP